MQKTSASKILAWRLAVKRARKGIFNGKMTPSFFRFMPKTLPPKEDMVSVMEDTFEDWTGEKLSRKKKATRGTRKYTKALYESLKREKQERERRQGNT